MPDITLDAAPLKLVPAKRSARQARKAQPAANKNAECAKILIQFAGVSYTPTQVLGDQKIFDEVWHVAVKLTHPDPNSGRGGADFNKVITARDRIKTLKGWL
jgi:hypothetical protein